MRFSLIRPPVPPEVDPALTGCSSAGCGGRPLQQWQAVPQPLRDTPRHPGIAVRSRWGRWGRPCRLYPRGGSHDQPSARLTGVAGMVSGRGMSSGAVASAWTALGWPRSKGAVSSAVQEAGAAVGGLRRAAGRHGGGRVVGLGVELTSVRWAGAWLTVGVRVEAGAGTGLTLDLLPNGEAGTLRAGGQELAAVLGADVLVSDAADRCQTAAAARGVPPRAARAMGGATPKPGGKR